MIERRRFISFRRVNHDELTAFRRRDAIPESIIALPHGFDSGSKNQWVGVVSHPLLSPRDRRVVSLLLSNSTQGHHGVSCGPASQAEIIRNALPSVLAYWFSMHNKRPTFYATTLLLVILAAFAATRGQYISADTYTR